MSETDALDQSGEQAVPPSQGSAGSSYQCLVRESRARMNDIEFWEDVFGTNVGVMIVDFDQYRDQYLDLTEDEEERGLDKPCTQCGELICGTDMMGRPMFHRQTEDDE